MGASSPALVADLGERFERDRKVFLSGDYKEGQLRAKILNGPCLTVRHSDFTVWTYLEGLCPVARRSDFGVCTFLDPFFTALGWDTNKPLKDIIGNLYYPDSPYEFSVMPADVLGQVYEQFLGKVIRLTAGHQAKVEERIEGSVLPRAFDMARSEV